MNDSAKTLPNPADRPGPLMQFIGKFARFGVAGGIGFVVDTGILYALIGVLGPYGARAVSFVAAVFTTWIINRHFAFRAHEKHLPLWREFGQYFLAMILGGAVNYGVYSVLVATVPLVAEHVVLGVAAGTGAGMLVNFFLAQRFVFGRG